MRFLVFMCGSSVVALLIGVGLTVWSYVQGPELAYETTVPLFFGTVLVTIVASWGHRLAIVATCLADDSSLRLSA